MNEDFLNENRRIDLGQLSARLIHIEAMLIVSMKLQVQILSNQESLDFDKMIKQIYDEVEQVSKDIFLNLPK